MKVRYNPILAGAFLVLGVISVIPGILVLARGEFVPTMIIGVMLVLLGVLYFVRPYFHLGSDSVTVPALVGPMRRDYAFTSLRVEGSRLVIIDRRGNSAKLPVFRWSAHPEIGRAHV